MSSALLQRIVQHAGLHFPADAPGWLWPVETEVRLDGCGRGRSPIRGRALPIGALLSFEPGGLQGA
eukprot:10724851-Alexandrium_andersonii.AAC.1